MICKKLQACMCEAFGSTSLSECDNKCRTICIESSDKRSSVKCEEKGKKYVYENTRKNHVISYKMDGGVIVEDKTVPFHTNKCDYLYAIKEQESTAILIELKGVNVSKSLSQISGTIVLYKDMLCMFDRVYARVIVASSTPNLKASPEYVKLEKTIRQTYKGNIKIAERQFHERDTDLSRNYPVRGNFS